MNDKDLTDAVNRLDSIQSDMLAGKFTFEEAVGVLSQDKDTRNNRGNMVNGETGTTRFEMSQLPQEVAKVVDTLQVGQISKAFIMTDPKLHREVVAIVKLSERIPAHRANLSDDYQMIKNMYEKSRQDKILADWLEKRSKILISVLKTDGVTAISATRDGLKTVQPRRNDALRRFIPTPQGRQLSAVGFQFFYRMAAPPQGRCMRDIHGCPRVAACHARR